MSIQAAVYSGRTEEGQLTQIAQVPFPQLQDDLVLIKTVACAANPADWKHFMYFGSKKGDIVGVDVAGVVQQVGKDVKNVKVGDFVGSAMNGNHSAVRGGFAEFTVVDPLYLIVLPAGSPFDEKPLPQGVSPSSSLNSFEALASVPLGLATIGVSFATNFRLKPETSRGKTILIWGGASSSGIVAIQVAKLIYGLRVIATASSKHHDFLKSLGADAVFDYHEEKAVEQIREYAKGSIVYAIDVIGYKETWQQTYDATADSAQLELDNLYLLGTKDLKLDPSRDNDNIRFFATVTYVSKGQNVHNTHIPEDFFPNYEEFWFNLVPSILPKIKTAQLKVLKPGLGSANEALELLRQNKVSGEKVVFRVA